MKTNYAGNTIHELPICEIVVNVPDKNSSWMRDFLKEQNYSPCVIVGETWGTSIWLTDPSKANAKILDVTKGKVAQKFDELRNTKSGVKIRGGVEADGVLVPIGEAFGIGTADCMTLVFCDNKKDLVVVAHAGRGSLLDMELVHGNGSSRKNFSVIDSVMKVFNNHKSKAKNLSIYAICSIGAKYFRHDLIDKEYGENNIKLISYLKKQYGSKTFEMVDDTVFGLNLFEIAAAQCSAYGIKRNQIQSDNVNTGKAKFRLSCGKKAKSGLASHRRGTDSRNFILVLHKPPIEEFKDPICRDM